jgi:ABC-2 type transport system permease protein
MILFFQQWRGELLKLFARRRTYIGFGAFVLLELLILWLIKVKGLGPVQKAIVGSGENMDYYFSALTVSLIVVSMSVFFLGAL